MNTREVSGALSGSGPPSAAKERFPAPFLCAVTLIAVTAGAAGLRLVRLDNRLMHCDEAVQAEKFRLLLEDGYYRYDPEDYHGPALNYLTLPIARLAGARKLTEVTEVHLRLVPALFGILLVVLVWALRDELGRPAALGAAALTAVSPAMVFYSRYYIHEMLLVCFTLGAIVALWRYARCLAPEAGDRPGRAGRAWIGRAFWLVVLGLSVGMMHASKETCVIPLSAIALAALLTLASLRRMGLRPAAISGLVVLLCAAGISALLFSSFLDHPRGVLDSVATYGHYLRRAWGEGSTGPHDHPWYHYLELLFWWRRGDGPVWTEAPIAALALVGLAAGATGRGLDKAHLPMARFLAVFTVAMTAVYSALPYKTPWCALGFLDGMILLAGVGAAVLVRTAPHFALKAVVIALVTAGVGYLAWGTYRASFAACDDWDNPYVYAHTSTDVPRLARAAEQIAEIYAEVEQTDPEEMFVQVLCPDGDYWPLPWYLRRFRWVWCSDRVPDPDLPSEGQGVVPPNGRATPPAAPLIITMPELEDAVLDYAYRRHVPGQPIMRQPLRKPGGTRWQLRPNVPLSVIVRHDLWEAYSAAQARTDGAAAGPAEER